MDGRRRSAQLALFAAVRALRPLKAVVLAAVPVEDLAARVVRAADPEVNVVVAGLAANSTKSQDATYYAGAEIDWASVGDLDPRTALVVGKGLRATFQAFRRGFRRVLLVQNNLPFLGKRLRDLNPWQACREEEVRPRMTPEIPGSSMLYTFVLSMLISLKCYIILSI